MSSRFAVAKEHVVRSLDQLVPKLFGGGSRTHRYEGRWAVVNPWRGDARLDQMSIWRTGNRRGAWKDYVSDDKGDAIDLVAFALEGMVTADSRKRALEWIETEFGLKDMNPETRAKIEREAKANAERLQQEEARTLKERQDRARKFFYSCQPGLVGTPAETYLASRAIRLEEVPRLGLSLRFHPACEYWMAAQRDGEGRKIGTVPRFPAIISAMVSADGTLNVCHYTFLEPDGSAKLKTGARGYVDAEGRPLSPKLMFPAGQGYVVRVTYGPSGLNCEDAAQRGIRDWVALCEGLEDSLSTAIGDPRLRVHMAGSLPGLLQVPDLACAKGYLVMQDNDWGKPQAQALFERAIARLKSFGKPVSTLAMPPDWGKDVNDALRS